MFNDERFSAIINVKPRECSFCSLCHHLKFFNFIFYELKCVWRLKDKLEYHHQDAFTFFGQSFNGLDILD